MTDSSATVNPTKDANDTAGVDILWLGGNCPVQAEGTVDGKKFYFRSRGEAWSMDIGGDDPCAKSEWSYEEDYGEWPEAGWITPEQAREFIAKAVALYRTPAVKPDTSEER